MLRKHLLLALSVLVVGLAVITPPAAAQLPFIQDIAIYSRLIRQVQTNSLNSACIRLDSRCLFKLAATDTELLADRINEIQKRFSEVTRDYLTQDDRRDRAPRAGEANRQKRPIVEVRPNGNLQDLYFGQGDAAERLFTVTSTDARAHDVSVAIRAEQLKLTIEAGLLQAQQERSPQYLRQQVIWGVCILAVIYGSNLPLAQEIRKLRKLSRKLAPSSSLKSLSVAQQLARRQKWNLIEISYRLLQLIQVFIWGGGILWILNLFPQTRIMGFLLIAALRIPSSIILVSLLVYFLIRFTYFLIAKLSSVVVDTQSPEWKINQRGQLRINTTTRILRSAVTIIWVVIGILLAFWVNGVNLAPILTGAGIFGLGLSFASQNLIKDAINGFIIIWDDRYAVGDIVDIGTVSGLVENINLRITQLRDAEGRLITIPNSAVDIVANRSSLWSRADIQIPIAYQTNIDRALDIIDQVAQTMTQAAEWQERIWEYPNILGVEQFSDRGVIIRVWIKTEPQKQWDVAREFRRRVKIAFDQAGIPIPIPQQEILWSQNSFYSPSTKQLKFPD